MKGYYRLVNNHFKRWLLFFAGLSFSAIVSPLLLIQLHIQNYNPYVAFERYEDVFIHSGSGYLFPVFLLLIFVFFGVEEQRNYSNSKPIYTYLTMPIRREAYYFSRLTVLITAILLLVACQLLAFRFGYYLYESRLSTIDNGANIMHNGWFLATIRSQFYRFLLPLSFSRGLSSVAILFLISSLFYYLLLIERCKKRIGGIFVVISYLILSNLIRFRWTESVYALEPSNLYITSTMMIVCTLFMIWHSLSIIKRGQVV